MTADVEIRDERPADQEAIRDVHRRAFGDDGRVAELVDALRAQDRRTRSFVATTSPDITVGHVMLSVNRLDAPRSLIEVYVLSPLAVLPAYHHNGIGSRLIRHAIDAAEADGMPLVFLEGSPEYYGARGFQRADALGFRAPSLRIPPPAFQVVRLSGYRPWMTGTLVYRDTFWALDCVGLREAQD